MKLARIAILGVAAIAGIIAWTSAKKLVTQPPQQNAVLEVKEPEILNEVLTARHDVPLGARIDSASLEWSPWPSDNIPATYISKTSRPDALKEFENAIATAPLYSGEPIRENNVVRQGRGFMSAILPSGKRAISIRVQNESRAAGFILPNDRIDVILSRIQRGTNTISESFNSETILSNIRVLAIDQTFEERDGEKFVTGEIATLELTPREAELIAMADQMGELALSLRSIADIQDQETDEDSENNLAKKLNGSLGQDNAVNVIKFGISSGK